MKTGRHPICKSRGKSLILARFVGVNLAGLFLAIGPTAARARQPAPATAPAGEMVALDFPADGVEVSLLADIVTRRLHIPILYDEQIKGKRVIVHVPMKVPESALMGILQSALRMKQLALVDAEQPGWKQIVPAPSLAGVASPAVAGLPTVGADALASGPITQVFVLTHADPTKVTELLRPFLSQPGGYAQAEAGQKVLIVSDYPSVVRRVEQLIHRLDSEAPPLEMRFVTLKKAEATSLVSSITQLISNRENYQWGTPGASGIFLTADERTNQLVVVAPPERINEVVQLITGMDIGTDLQTKLYRLKTVSPDRVDRLVRSLLDPSILKHGYQAAVDRDSQMLVVSATPQVHSEIEDLLKDYDVPQPESQNPIQYYKLKNTKAADVLATISDLLGDARTEGSAGESLSGSKSATSGTLSAGQSVAPPLAPGDSAPAVSAGGSSIGSAAVSSAADPRSGQRQSLGHDMSFSESPSSNLSIGNTPNVQYASPALSFLGEPSGSRNPGTLSARGRNATVAADVNTNMIIVVAPPQTQQMYADLIKRLDERRPQVQIECTIVTLDTSSGFTFGVDIGRLGGFDTSKLLTLSSFGVSTADAATGKLTPVAAPGGTFALLSPKIADVVMRALANNSRARLVSAPELLVNDNGKGKLESVSQQPFAVILDASSTQSLTSLGGLAQAGTSISVEPHISEADYLQLSYSIELSNFTGSAQAGLPPPSQKNAVDSSVTIPDGYTIVVGGLTTKNLTEQVNSIPILGDIPVLKYFFGSRSSNTQDQTLFVFIRPVILRDDKFEDLKYLSSRSTNAAGIKGDFPRSFPVPMH